MAPTALPMVADDPRPTALDPLLDPVRLAALRRSGLLDGPPELAFDRLTRLAGKMLHAPVALVSLVDDHRQFFKSIQGLPEPWASRRETPLSHSFCQHVVRQAGPLVIGDAREHPLVRENLAIRDLGVIAYLGAPLTDSDGNVFGAFCVIDGRPRPWNDLDLEMVTEMAASTMTEVELRLDVARRREVEQQLAALLERAEGLNRQLAARSVELASLNQELERLARFDGLTGLLNIRAMRESLADRASFCLREGLPLSIAMIDVDHFKSFNDTFGHPAGDEVLQVVADALRLGIRGHDLAARYGGEEFILGLPGTRLDEASALADRLRGSIESYPWPFQAVTVSIGVASAHCPTDVNALIRFADETLYLAKHSGRNQVCADHPTYCL